LSNEAYSVNGLPKFETYGLLTSYYNKVVSGASALQSSLDSVNDWRTQYSGYNAQLAEKAIRSHPIIRDEAVVRGLVGKVNRIFPVPELLAKFDHPARDHCRKDPENPAISELAKRAAEDSRGLILPAALTGAENADRVLEDYSTCKIPGALLTSHDPKSGEISRTWLILNNNVTPLTLSYPIWHPDYRKEWIDFIAETILSGDSEKLEWMSRRFVEYASAEVNTLRKLQEALRELMLPASSLKMNVSLYNVGRSPIAIKPAFAVHIIYQDTKIHDLNNIVMVADPGVVSENPDSHAPAGLDARTMPPKPDIPSKEDELVQRHASSPYFAIGPSGQTELALTSVAPLESNAAALHGLLTAGSTQFQLVAERAGGGLIWLPRPASAETQGPMRLTNCRSLPARISSIALGSTLREICCQRYKGIQASTRLTGVRNGFHLRPLGALAPPVSDATWASRRPFLVLRP
jgi:hypothetical protein